MKGGYVYILTNKNHTTLYTGVTSNLYARVYEHKEGKYPGFSKKYNCTELVYWEFIEDIESAIHREKRIKKFARMKKEELINKVNPKWDDLFNGVSEMQ